ncbi:MAG: O-antigen ligase family protein [Lentisphaeria bacterium]|nr:O-antigen ligase family protein [Lentisphaeria bacterium]
MDPLSKTKNFSFAACAAVFLLVLPLFSYPLVWKKLLTGAVPMWGEVQLVSLQVLGLCAPAVVLFFPERLGRIWAVVRLRFLLIFAVAGVCVSGLQQLLYGGPPELLCTAGFYFFLPLAGAVFSNELKRFFPLFAAALFPPVLAVTCRSADFSGWAGNWNWNFSLLAVTLSGCFFLVPSWSVRRAGLAALTVITLALTVFSLAYPEIAPRGTFAGIIGATVIILVFRNIMPARRWAFALWAAALTLVLFIGSAGKMFNSIRDSRFQLWRGSFDFLLANFPLGTGPDRFESMVLPYLPEVYYFTPFAAARHPHPHNELFNYAAGYGLAGAVFFIMLLLCVLRGIRFRDRVGLWLGWTVLLLAIHGQFDVLLSVPLTGCWFLLGAGAVAAGGVSRAPRSFGLSPAKIPLFLAGTAGLAAAAVMAAGLCLSTGHLRRARLLLMEKRSAEARKYLEKSLKCHVTPAALYTAGAVELFDFRNPDGAIALLERIPRETGLPLVYHSNALLARAYAVKGDLARSVKYFDAELANYPFSAIASGLRLSVLRRMASDSRSIAGENARFAALMKMRGLDIGDFPLLLRNQELDDSPLKNSGDGK